MLSQYDLDSLLPLLKDFYSLAGTKICVLDSDGREICYYPERLTEFCSLLRENEQMDAACKDCDKRGIAICKKTHRQYTYTCHAGLTECVAPILSDGEIVGYLLIGQVKNGDSPNSSVVQAISDPAKRKELIAKYRALPSVSLEKLNAAIHIMDVCTGYEHLRDLMRYTDQRIDRRLGEYVRDNLTGDLSVNTLCRQFCVSRNEIYALFKSYFGTTPASYIKNQRMQHACALLSTGALPVHTVAELCGIPDYNYFTKLFKKAIGTTPTAYRNKKTEV